MKMTTLSNWTQPLSTMVSLLAPNETSGENEESDLQNESWEFYIYYYGMFCLVAVVNLTGNSLVISTIIRHRQLQYCCNWFLLSLGFSDLLQGFVYPIYNLSHIEISAISEPLGAWSLCQFLLTEVLALDLGSSYHLVCITVIRYIAVVHPLKYHNYVNEKRILVCIVFIWLSTQTTIILLYTIHIPEGEYVGACRYENIFRFAHTNILFIIQLFLPVTIMTCLYIPLIRIARKQAKVIAIQECSVTRSAITSQERKSTYMVTSLLGCFAIFWTPTVIYFYASIALKGNINHYIRATVRILLFMNSAINVFVYAGRDGEFRNILKKDLKKLSSFCKCCHKSDFH
ncbi:octopamine receptor beta-2R-like [Octopus vulgaris]|uniref:Octopamine receptor beta-2R-like n=1 Tax=Octopus vulgaris TaxID=6645 RepID=A0AA36FHY0_OCTVU|nr:octopamine receptor beta-2R-like [Octopus vulgaris]